MCRYSNNPASSGAAAAKIVAILVVAVAMTWGANAKSAWRQLVHISSVNCMTFEGPLCWAGTTAGLMRFDEGGDGMNIYTNCNSPLPSNIVNALVLGRDSSLWIGTSAGLARLKQGEWQIYNGPGSKALYGVTALLPGDGGDVWAGLDYGGVFKVSAGKWMSLASTYPGFPLAVVTCPIRSIARDWANRLWMTWTDYTSSSMACLDGSKWTPYNYYVYGLLATESDSSIWMAAATPSITPAPAITRIRPDGTHEYPNTGQYMQVLAADRNENLWIASNNAIADFSGQAPRLIASPILQNSGTYIKTMAFDTANTPWVGLGCSYPDTAQVEILKFTGSGWLRYKVSSNSCPFSTINRIVLDHSGNSWIGDANNVHSVWMFDGSSWTRSSRIDSILGASWLVSMALDANGSAWFATDRALIRRSSSGQVTLYDSSTIPFLSYGAIAGFAVDQSGRGLVALQGTLTSYAYKIIAFNLSTRLIQDSISIRAGSNLRQLAASPDGVWCVFGYQGVGRWNHETGFRQFDSSNGALYSYVNGLAAGPDSSVWIGGKGLVRYKAGAWTRFDTSWNALPGLYCEPLAGDKKGGLWAAVYLTENRLASGGFGSDFVVRAQSIPAGLAYYDGGRWTQYTTINSGLPGNAPTCAAIDDSGTVWVGTNAGVGIFQKGATSETFKPSGRRQKEPSLALSLSGSRNAIQFRLPRAAKVTVTLFDLQGRLQHTLLSEPFSPGEHILALSGLVGGRIALTSNVYVALLEANYGNVRDRRTMVFNRCKQP